MEGSILERLGLAAPDRLDTFLDETGKVLETIFVDLPKEGWKEIKWAGRWAFSGPRPEVPPDNEILKIWGKVHTGENPTVIDTGTDSKDKKYFAVVAQFYENKRKEIDDKIKPVEDWLRQLEEDNAAIAAQLEASEKNYTDLVQEKAHIERMNLEEIQQLEEAEDQTEDDEDSYGLGAENYEKTDTIVVKDPGLSDEAKKSVCDPDNPKRCLSNVETELAGVEETLDSLRKNIITIDRVKVAEIKAVPGLKKLGELLEKRLSAAGTVELPVAYIMATLQKLLKGPQERRAKYETNRDRARAQVARFSGNLEDRKVETPKNK